MRISRNLSCILLTVLSVSPITLPTVQAQQSEAGVIEEIVIIGSRRQDGRSQAESLVPVDVISGDDFMAQGSTGIDSQLANLVPSYNIDQQPINDAATLVRPAKLRGLPPDSTLVLVNGKRRHRASVITFLGNGVADGSQGPDISSIPAIALKRVEVLRDGAAAQYGSDAIAGVINFELKDDAEGGTVEARWGEFYDGDGDGFNVSGNIGLPLSSNGFANLSFEYKEADPTNRSQQRSDAQALVDAGNTYITDPNYDSVFHPNVMVWGAPEFEYDYKFFGNAGFDISDNMEVYGYGNYAKRKVEGGFYFRNPHTRSGVFAGPVRYNDQINHYGNTFKVDDIWSRDTPAQSEYGKKFDDLNDSQEEAIKEIEKELLKTGNLYNTVKVADLDGAGMGGTCPIIRITDNVAGPEDIAAVQADPNCESFITRFPGGFVPRFGGTMEDYGFAMGVRGELFNDWHVDLSGVYGRHQAEFFMKHTLNPQLLAKPDVTVANIPTDYSPGTYTETDYTINLDVSKLVDLAAFYSPLSVAFGLEHRQEKFKVTEGGETSWFQDLSPGGITTQGFGVGSNGFTGFGPRLAGTWSRNSYAAYMDLEAELSQDVLLGAAGRYEDHKGVGETMDVKLSVRGQVNDNFAVRGAVSTGFRAPTVGQANILNVTTAFSGGVLADEATLPPTHPASALVGGKPLTPEESINYTIGTVFNVGDVDITVDYFHIKVKDRIARGSERKLTDADRQTLINQGVTDASAFSQIRFYTNDFDTTTQGVDVIATYPMDLLGGRTNFSFAGNWTETTVDKFNPKVISDKRVVQLEKNLPRTRFTLSANHLQGPWTFLARARYYGKFTEFTTDDEDERNEAEARALVDIEGSYTFKDSLTLAAGAENVFDTKPSRLTSSGGNVAGLVYTETSPYGFNGGFFYFRALWNY